MIDSDSRWMSELDGSTVLVTGASGLVGSAVVEKLIQANTEGCTIDVVASGRNIARLQSLFGELSEGSRVTFLAHDVLNPFPEDVSADFIVQAASPAHPLAFANSPVEVLCSNLIGTKNALELARRCEARLLFISSGEVYGPNPPEMPFFKEDYTGMINPLLPRSCYPEGKRAAENLCVSYLAEYGVSTVIARLCYVFGRNITEQNMRADAQFLRNALAGNEIILKSSGDQLRTYCYADDAARAILTILALGQSGEAYNVANRNCIVTVRQYAEALAKEAGVGIEFREPSNAEKSGFSKSSCSVLDPEKLEQLGWVPEFDLAGSMKELLKE